MISAFPAAPIQTYQEALQFMERLDVSAMKLGLERVRAVLDSLGNPQDALPMVHVAGTNGKGSVTAMLGAVFKAAGYRTGTFTSPHLVHVRERIAVNGNPILADDFQFEVQALKQHLENLHWPPENWPTYFEFLNIMAYRYFVDKKADVTVFETGLGGRLDSTNVVKHPNLTVITTIGMDHMHLLGNTLGQIAAEKAGILKPGTPLVLGGNLPDEARTVILQRARTLDVPVTEVNANQLKVLPSSCLERGLVVQTQAASEPYQLNLLAPYQKDNLAVVLACVDQLRKQGFHLEESAVRYGLSRTLWPARFQYFEQDGILLDGSHNADGFQALSEGLALYFKGYAPIWLVSLRANRELEPLLSVLSGFGKPLAVITTQAEPSHLYHSPQFLAEQIRACLGGACGVTPAQNSSEALALLQEALRRHAAEKPVGIVTGSLYTAGDILARLGRSGPVASEHP